MAKEIYSDIVLDREEHYDASMLDCWAFAKGTDVKNGIELKLGNMVSGFPIDINNVVYPCSEILYLWGCKNVELRRARTARKKELDAIKEVELRKIDNIGTFVGKNNMGKILMLCKRALENNAEPPIDYPLLNSCHIHLNTDKPLF